MAASVEERPDVAMPLTKTLIVRDCRLINFWEQRLVTRGRCGAPGPAGAAPVAMRRSTLTECMTYYSGRRRPTTALSHLYGEGSACAPDVYEDALGVHISVAIVKR